MPASQCSLLAQNEESDGLEMLAEAVHLYLGEIEECRAICELHKDTAAIHTKGKELQVFRMFKRDDTAITYLKNMTKQMPGWEESPHWLATGQKWQKLERDVTSRMKKHTKQIPIATKGVDWEGTPILIHAYKFETDPNMKLELILPDYESDTTPLPIQAIAEALRCHDHLLPQYMATALPPYERHETAFQTIPEYLAAHMPPARYASHCLTSMGCAPVFREGVLPHQ